MKGWCNMKLTATIKGGIYSHTITGNDGIERTTWYIVCGTENAEWRKVPAFRILKRKPIGSPTVPINVSSTYTSWIDLSMLCIMNSQVITDMKFIGKVSFEKGDPFSDSLEFIDALIYMHNYYAGIVSCDEKLELLNQYTKTRKINEVENDTMMQIAIREFNNSLQPEDDPRSPKYGRRRRNNLGASELSELENTSWAKAAKAQQEFVAQININEEGQANVDKPIKSTKRKYTKKQYVPDEDLETLIDDYIKDLDEFPATIRSIKNHPEGFEYFIDLYNMVVASKMPVAAFAKKLGVSTGCLYNLKSKYTLAAK